MFFPTLSSRTTPSPPLSSSYSCSTDTYKLTPSKTAQCPQFVAYKIRPPQVSCVHKALSEIIPDFSDAECDARQDMDKSIRHDTQVLFATRDHPDTPQPQEAMLLSLGSGPTMQIFHIHAPACESSSWIKWCETTADVLGLQKIELPHTLFREDLAWMLRAHASSKCVKKQGYMLDLADEATDATGTQQHAGDTHLINRVERYIADIVFVFRKKVGA